MYNSVEQSWIEDQLIPMSVIHILEIRITLSSTNVDILENIYENSVEKNEQQH